MMTWTVRFKERARHTSALVVAALMVATCAAPGATTPLSTTPPTPPTATAGSSAPAGSPTPPPITTAPVTLTVEDIEGGNAGPNASLDQLNKEFMAKYPNVTINRVKSAFNNLVAKQPLELSGPNPPDVTEIVVANDAFAKFGNNGLIVNLDAYAKEYGWTDRFPPDLLNQARFDSTGLIGSGPLYGIYQGEDVIGIFYNKAKLAKLGLQVPATFEDFQASLTAAKQAGEIPMMVGGLDGCTNFVYNMVLNRFVSTADMNGWAFHTKTVSYNSQPFQDAATLFQTWGTGGLFEPNLNDVSCDDAWKRFTQGQGLYLPAGTWYTAGIKTAMGDNAGLFLAPASAHDPGFQVEGGQGQFWALSAHSKNPDVGAAYLDFITSQRAGQILIANGAQPGFRMDPTTTTTIAPGLSLDYYQAIQTVNSKYSISTFPEVATPTILNAETANIQELVVGKMTPADFVKAEQADYDKFWKK